MNPEHIDDRSGLVPDDDDLFTEPAHLDWFDDTDVDDVLDDDEYWFDDEDEDELDHDDLHYTG